ncbi:MAG: tRNA (N(6)-L-threonylcarbamoyladenosine(37)-C(2))-methylthiotransferase [Saccharolobus sp.]|uniref:tRNA (N(6)-L-threonylcarbamoyladenosine(37)-C(2))- methylthiotransferase n=1 Tax=Saccharolobus TaxID=2100760 RepID=UPI001F0FF2DB|nr:tRNA (N(6)-L-threonylcarbamoyladenosine(37)-C(2))-methylthiotransferase [Saccharolobus shibatae]MCH4815273.1 tRNA (N(6)-L-threonylcarbamoyladenosine(37)-C(2))-methylthiotransferase [Saccharolobus shibatae]
MKTIYVETYGCALNRADTYVMMTLLKSEGYNFVENPENADIIILNTCAVRLETEERMKQRIKELNTLSKKLVVAGCMSSAEPATVLSIAPNASLIGPQSVERIIDVIKSEERKIVLEGDRALITPRTFDGKIAIIPVADGCAGNCSFCITKLARRKLRSYPLREIVNAARDAVKAGAKEIELTGQDTAAYGLDLGGSISLVDVVNKVTEIDGDFMIRIGMMTPEQAMRIIDNLIEVMRNPKVYKFIHLPVQSGDDRVLKLMNRKYTIDEYKELVSEIRSKIPFANITTDIIIGHPREDEDAFNNTLLLMKELRFERIHLAMYSIRPNTRSASMPQVPDSVKKKRIQIANKLYEDIALSIHLEYVGSTSRVITTELGRKGSVVGRLMNYIPVVIRSENVELGKWYNVKITEASFYDLRGVFA